jgi:integrase
MYEQYVQDSFGKLKIRDVKKSDVRRFYNQLHDTRGLSFNTIEVIQNVLNQLFTLAVDDDYIRKNPAMSALGDCKKAHNYQRPKRHALTIPEQKAFMSYIKNTPKFSHWLPIFTFFLGTGCRVSEVISLRWEDVDMEDGIISINHGITYYQRETKVCKFQISENTKTEAGTRMIPMLSDVKQAILNEKEYQEEIGIKCLANYNGYTNFIFLNRFGDVHNPETINRTIKRIILAYNIEETEKADAENREPLLLPNFSCHNLRHTFATRYCENESNIKVIQEILGHKDIATTMDVYMEATKDAKKKSFTELDGKIKIT